MDLSNGHHQWMFTWGASGSLRGRHHHQQNHCHRHQWISFFTWGASGRDRSLRGLQPPDKTIDNHYDHAGGDLRVAIVMMIGVILMWSFKVFVWWLWWLGWEYWRGLSRCLKSLKATSDEKAQVEACNSTIFIVISHPVSSSIISHYLLLYLCIQFISFPKLLPVTINYLSVSPFHNSGSSMSWPVVLQSMSW